MTLHFDPMLSLSVRCVLLNLHLHLSFMQSLSLHKLSLDVPFDLVHSYDIPIPNSLLTNCHSSNELTNQITLLVHPICFFLFYNLPPLHTIQFTFSPASFALASFYPTYPNFERTPHSLFPPFYHLLFVFHAYRHKLSDSLIIYFTINRYSPCPFIFNPLQVCPSNSGYNPLICICYLSDSLHHTIF